MAYKVSLSPVARADLHRIDDFLSERSEAVADRALAQLERAIESLSNMPARGRRGSVAFRELIVPFGRGSYILRYRIDQKTVLVTRIFHSLEDRPLA